MSKLENKDLDVKKVFLGANSELTEEEIYKNIVTINEKMGNYDNGYKYFDELKTLTNEILWPSYDESSTEAGYQLWEVTGLMYPEMFGMTNVLINGAATNSYTAENFFTNILQFLTTQVVDEKAFEEDFSERVVEVYNQKIAKLNQARLNFASKYKTSSKEK